MILIQPVHTVTDKLGVHLDCALTWHYEYRFDTKY